MNVIYQESHNGKPFPGELLAGCDDVGKKIKGIFPVQAT